MFNRQPEGRAYLGLNFQRGPSLLPKGLAYREEGRRYQETNIQEHLEGSDKYKGAYRDRNVKCCFQVSLGILAEPEARAEAWKARHQGAHIL